MTLTKSKEMYDAVYTLRISRQEVIGARLNRNDFSLLRGCERSAKISDKILGLTILARRIEESQ